MAEEKAAQGWDVDQTNCGCSGCKEGKIQSRRDQRGKEGASKSHLGCIETVEFICETAQKEESNRHKITLAKALRLSHIHCSDGAPSVVQPLPQNAQALAPREHQSRSNEQRRGAGNSKFDHDTKDN